MEQLFHNSPQVVRFINTLTYFRATLSHFADAKGCFDRAGIRQQWDAMVAEVLQAHHRKVGFMPSFERLAAGQGLRQEPSFLDRARNRWLSRG